MFYAQFAPLEIILVLFLPLCATYFIRQKHVFQKGPFPPTDLAENLCMEPQKPPRSEFKSWQMGFSGSKMSLRVRVLKKAEITPEAQGCPPQPAPLQKSPLQGIHPCRKVFTGYPPLSRNFYRIHPPLSSTLNQIFWYRFQMHIIPTTIK